MKRADYIIIISIVSCWVAEYLYLLAPRGTNINMWAFNDVELSIRWYIYEVIMSLRFIIFASCLYFRPKKIHIITSDVLLINIIVVLFSLVWFVVFYHNPFHISEAAIKGVVVAVVYLSIRSIRYAKHDNRISGRGNIRGVN